MNQKGLTLVELLVVSAIIMVLTAVIIPNWRRGGGQLRVLRSAYRVNQDLRRAQELTLAHTEFSCPGSQSISGYGLHFEPNRHTYVLFGDCDGDNNYDESSEKKEEIELEQGVKIKALSDENDTPIPGQVDIVFKAPDPTVTIEASPSLVNNPSKVKIKVGNDDYYKWIKTNRAGLVEIDESQ